MIKKKKDSILAEPRRIYNLGTRRPAVTSRKFFLSCLYKVVPAWVQNGGVPENMASVEPCGACSPAYSDLTARTIVSEFLHMEAEPARAKPHGLSQRPRLLPS